MKIWINKKTGVKYPEHGCMHSFWVKSNGRVEFFERGKGTRAEKLKNWEQVEIEDLPEDFTLAQWREYAAKHGRFIAQEVLPCCDYVKPSWAALRLNPKYPDDDLEAWFSKIFGVSARGLCSDFLAMFGVYCFDIVGFENVLVGLGYDRDSNTMSMRDFIIQKWGQDVCEKFEKAFIDTQTKTGNIKK